MKQKQELLRYCARIIPLYSTVVGNVFVWTSKRTEDHARTENFAVLSCDIAHAQTLFSPILPIHTPIHLPNRGFNEHVQDPCNLNSQHSQRGCFVHTWTKFGNFWKSGAIVQKAEVRYCNFAFFYIFCFYFVFRIIINVEKNTERFYLGNFFTVALSFHVSVSTSHQLLRLFFKR